MIMDMICFAGALFCAFQVGKWMIMVARQLDTINKRRDAL